MTLPLALRSLHPSEYLHAELNAALCHINDFYSFLPVAQSKQNLNALRALLVALSALREAERRACWGRPLGSRALWGHHDHAIARITHIANSIRIQEVSSK